jgi:5-methylcytosine-specific restriction endonuclease McrA
MSDIIKDVERTCAYCGRPLNSLEIGHDYLNGLCEKCHGVGVSVNAAADWVPYDGN